MGVLTHPPPRPKVTLEYNLLILLICREEDVIGLLGP